MAADVSVMWFRRDLRVHDHPALTAAAAHASCVCVFVFDQRLLTTGRFPSAIRTRFMLGCLAELDAALRERGGKLVVRHGRPEEELPRLCAEVGAGDVYLTAGAAPWARERDRHVAEALGDLHELDGPELGPERGEDGVARQREAPGQRPAAALAVGVLQRDALEDRLGRDGVGRAHAGDARLQRGGEREDLERRSGGLEA